MKRLWNWVLSKALTWDQIAKFGEAAIFRSAYVAFFAVPLAVKVFASVPEKVVISNLLPPVTLHLRLPFSWKLLFLSACLASAANLLYSLRCPGLVRKYRGWSDFEADGRGFADLCHGLSELTPNAASILLALKSSDKASKSFDPEVDWAYDLLTNAGVLADDDSERHNFANTMFRFFNGRHFSTARDGLVRCRPGSRLTCSAIYLMASAAVIVILMQNLLAVALFMWQGRF